MCVLLDGQIGEWSTYLIANGFEVVIVFVCPSVFKYFGSTAACFIEACVAYLAVVHEYLSTGSVDGLLHVGSSLWMLITTGDTFVALAVVVGTYIKAFVCISLVPNYMAIWIAEVRLVGACRRANDRTEYPTA